MYRYILKRLLLAIPVLIGATFLVFTIMDFAPGDPAKIILGNGATEEALILKRAELGLDRPFFIRYGSFLLDLLKGDMGISYRNGQAVTDLIFGRLSNTLLLASLGMLFAVVIGIPIGIISAVKQYSALDNITMVLTLFFMAVPTFWLGMILVLIFALHLGLFPPSGMMRGFPDLLQSLVLPTITLGCGYAALIARTTRSSVLEVMRQDYIDTARSKGITERKVIWRHMMKNALIPIVTVIGLNFGTLLGGSVLTESIFSWPGVGRFVVESISFKDIPSVLGSVVTLAVLFSLVNLIVDILYSFLDPRIKSQYQTKKRGKLA
ncbi:MAG: ABC transporter permease [Clostridiaceae bacterium]|nr:ABC transporter permease [Clostridiaceae bacterium]